MSDFGEAIELGEGRGDVVHVVDAATEVGPGIAYSLTPMSSACLDMLGSFDPGRAVGAAAPWDPVFSPGIGDTAGLGG